MIWSKRPWGVGFVTFATHEAASRAITAGKGMKVRLN